MASMSIPPASSGGGIWADVDVVVLDPDGLANHTIRATAGWRSTRWSVSRDHYRGCVPMRRYRFDLDLEEFRRVYRFKRARK